MSLDYRIGYGEDIHRLVAGRRLVLCGTTIPFDLGLLGHSDADVAFHAVGDALLGSLGLGDIGKYFPPKDPSCAGLDSLVIVKKCLGFIKDKGYAVHNCDVSLIAEEPRLSPYIDEMKKNLALALEVKENQVSVKAMTNEGLDAIGRGEAIKAVAVLTILKENV